MRLSVPFLMVVLLCGGQTVTAFEAGIPPRAEVIRIVAKPVPLDEANPLRAEIGHMRYAGGWVISSESEKFGGFSGLVVQPERRHLIAISDRGDWLETEFDAKAKTLSELGSIQPYFDDPELEKADRDSESVIAWDDGLAVSFEFKHRVEWVPAPGKQSKPLPAAQHVDFSAWGGNSGAEAMVRLLTGDLLLFAERGRNVAGVLKAVLANERAASPLTFKPPHNFAPTDAALLPNGDILVLLRRFSLVDGVAAKIIRIDQSTVLPDATLIGTELLHLPPQLTVDNMEGIDIVPLDGETVRIVMISDDNFIPVQRTLLLMFDYKYKY